MLRRAGAFAVSRNDEAFIPSYDDSQAALESKWGKWVHKESFKRLAKHLTMTPCSPLTCLADLFFISLYMIRKHQSVSKNHRSFRSRSSNYPYLLHAPSGLQRVQRNGEIFTFRHKWNLLLYRHLLM